MNQIKTFTIPKSKATDLGKRRKKNVKEDNNMQIDEH